MLLKFVFQSSITREKFFPNLRAVALKKIGEAAM
jgi:hypothetical protein